MEIIIYPVLVQGTESRQIVEAIDYFNKNNYVDVIIVVEGEGL